MRKNIFTISILFLLFIACQQKKDTSMSFKDNSVILRNPSTTANKWSKKKGEVYIDTLNLYKEQNSIRINSSKQDSIKGIYVWYAFDLSEIDAKNITVTGKYKVIKAETSEIVFKIQQYSKPVKADSIFIDCNVSPKWTDFKIEAQIDKETDWAVFYIVGEGNIEILLNNCQAFVDGIPLSDFISRGEAIGTDREFDKGSSIELEVLTPLMTENLEVLGKVWGFLKYYHPEVTRGKYNWDYELFRVLPEIANAKNLDERSKLIIKWIDRYERVEGVMDYSISDSTKYSRLIDLSWLEDKSVFNDNLIEELENIKNSKRSQRFNYYIPVPSLDRTQEYFERERAYKNIAWDDQGFRVLTLFRLWNMIEYCFPYTQYTDIPWHTLLKVFIPKFVLPKDKTNYKLAILELAANMKDSHGHIVYKNNQVLSNTVVSSFFAKNKVPVSLTYSSEGYIVVQSTQSDFFNRGDIILSIEGKSVNDIIKEMEPYVIASNKNGMIRHILPHLLSSQSDQLQVEIMRDGEKKSVEINSNRSKERKAIKSWKDYNLDSRNIIHVDNIKSAEENKDIVLQNMNSKGIIIDMRKYPINNMEFLRPITLSKYPLWISKNDKSFPGNYCFDYVYDNNIKSEKKSIYKGKIVILVDENTQSAGETLSMMHRLAPNSLIVGRQTAGANGNVKKMFLPGGVLLQYTLYGAYYPNWEILQRKGVKIDIPVSPTFEDIKNGRDVWIEKAIELIDEI